MNLCHQIAEPWLDLKSTSRSEHDPSHEVGGQHGSEGGQVAAHDPPRGRRHRRPGWERDPHGELGRVHHRLVLHGQLVETPL